jgi:DNA-binding transcriptional LysR family regulator
MIDKLEFLVAIAREKNFRRAAEACGVAQPTLSAGLKALEDSLNVLLVRRSSRFQGLTPEGERVLEWAKRMVADSRAMRAEVRSLRKGLSGLVRIGVIPTALPWIPVLTSRFQQAHPNVRVTLLSRSSIEILEMLDGLEADAGVTYLDNEAIGRLRAQPLFVERFRLLARADTEIGQRAEVSWSEVARTPLCLLTPDMQNRRIIDRMLRPYAPEPGACTLESDSVVALFSHVRHGGCSAIISERLAETLAEADSLRAVPIVDPVAQFRVGLVMLDREPMTPVLQALGAVARQVAAEAPGSDRVLLSQH